MSDNKELDQALNAWERSTSQENEKKIAELGRTQTFKDIETALKSMREEKRVKSVRKRQAKDETERARGEFQVFLDDVQSITGLPPRSREFWQVVAKTIQARFARHRLASEQQSKPTLEGWPDADGDLMGGFKDDSNLPF